MKTTLKVEDMHCAGCAGSVDRGLRRLTGITDVRVELAAKMVSVEHDPAVKPPQLIEHLNGAGFRAELVKQ